MSYETKSSHFTNLTFSIKEVYPCLTKSNVINISLNYPSLDLLDRALREASPKTGCRNVRSIYVRDVKLTNETIGQLLKHGVTYNCYYAALRNKCPYLCDVYLFES